MLSKRYVFSLAVNCRYVWGRHVVPDQQVSSHQLCCIFEAVQVYTSGSALWLCFWLCSWLCFLQPPAVMPTSHKSLGPARRWPWSSHFPFHKRSVQSVLSPARQDPTAGYSRRRINPWARGRLAERAELGDNDYDGPGLRRLNLRSFRFRASPTGSRA